MKLIEDWKQRVWRLWSVRLAALAGLASGYLVAYPDTLQSLISYVPGFWRPAATVAVSLIVWGVPTWTRLVVQQPKACPPKDAPDA